MNSIEERENIIELLKQALKFYANQENYRGNRSVNVCGGGTSVSLVEVDEGSQARFALEKAGQLAEQNQKIQDDYDKLMSASEQLQYIEDIADPQKLMEAFKVLGDENNNIQ
jgi:hypothetical protein